MQLRHAADLKPRLPLAAVKELLDSVSEVSLRAWVEQISVPRHYFAEAAANRKVARWLETFFESRGFAVSRVGQFDNILAVPKNHDGELTLVGAHYDSVPGTPGADDNGSAVAAMLGCAEACALLSPVPPVGFIAFNREEDGLLGSREFVEHELPRAGFQVTAMHVLEMVGFASHVPGSQRIPSGLPVRIPDTGNFLGLLANRDSHTLLAATLQKARDHAPEFPVIGLRVLLGMERFFPVLARSDHAPFWDARIPALMWTDTSEFRNPHYHLASDTPDTLDYAFLRQVTQALIAAVL